MSVYFQNYLKKRAEKCRTKFYINTSGNSFLRKALFNFIKIQKFKKIGRTNEIGPFSKDSPTSELWPILEAVTYFTESFICAKLSFSNLIGINVQLKLNLCLLKFKLYLIFSEFLAFFYWKKAKISSFKYWPSEATIFSHLSANYRIPSLKYHWSILWFLQKTRTGAPQTPVQRRKSKHAKGSKSGEYGGWGKTSHLSNSR